jgi:hypothetical protein
MKIKFAKIIPTARGFLVSFGELDEITNIFISSGASIKKIYKKENRAIKAKQRYEGIK